MPTGSALNVSVPAVGRISFFVAVVVTRLTRFAGVSFPLDPLSVAPGHRRFYSCHVRFISPIRFT